jgi:ABC-type multidrug transport system permease subunit
MARIARKEDVSIMLMFSVLLCQFTVFPFVLNTIEEAKRKLQLFIFRSVPLHQDCRLIHGVVVVVIIIIIIIIIIITIAIIVLGPALGHVACYNFLPSILGSYFPLRSPACQVQSATDIKN